jgi:hypothetical protein
MDPRGQVRDGLHGDGLAGDEAEDDLLVVRALASGSNEPDRSSSYFWVALTNARIQAERRQAKQETHTQAA